jgi:hypothetical protein
MEGAVAGLGGKTVSGCVQLGRALSSVVAVRITRVVVLRTPEDEC